MGSMTIAGCSPTMPVISNRSAATLPSGMCPAATSNALSPSERDALALVEGAVAAGWVADRLLGLVPELRRQLPHSNSPTRTSTVPKCWNAPHRVTGLVHGGSRTRMRRTPPEFLPADVGQWFVFRCPLAKPEESQVRGVRVLFLECVFEQL
ncbi:hypothetical protein [Nocardia sp. NBC_01388]|uniref:hypothetical protein n=1 Tax=Nocardia sp. NBC_01388 TaxID=2903596 RepID=UPI003244FB88